jgi:hypothetical protein
MTAPRKMGPLKEDHPLVMNMDLCPACRHVFIVGQYVTLVTLGPGENAEEREKARGGGAYTAVAAPVHWACATGEDA